MEWQNGIDTVAHKATLEVKGNTIAVLANGFNNIYPEQNVDLFNEIIRSRGLIVSEYQPNEVAEPYKFLKRNRIISGLSLGVLVIEAKHRSGTSVTARIAKSQGRKVFALPHEIWDKNGVGTNRLIKEGAILVTETRDIMEQFENLEYKANESKQKDVNKKIKTNLNQNKEYDVQENRNLKIEKIENKDYQQIYKIMDNKLYSIDEICRKTQKNISEIQQILLMMEIEGYVKRIGGGYKCI